MRQFFETTFGPEELDMVGKVLEEWRLLHGLPTDSEEAQIAASAILNMYREGKRSRSELEAAMASHIGLQDLLAVLRPQDQSMANGP